MPAAWYRLTAFGTVLVRTSHRGPNCRSRRLPPHPREGSRSGEIVSLCVVHYLKPLCFARLGRGAAAGSAIPVRSSRRAIN
jgi:hypothetical protein